MRNADGTAFQLCRFLKKQFLKKVFSLSKKKQPFIYNAITVA